MNKKLLAIASFIKNNSIIADIGCDHAYLSLILFKQKKIKFAYNIDINIGPLNQGKNNLELNGYINQCEFILNDGLKDKYLILDYVIIAGMGANNMIDIIEQSNAKTKFYILQPNTNVHLLRIFLKNKNAEILDELLVYDSNNYYEVLLVKFSSKSNIIDNFDIFIGPFIKKLKTNEFKLYICNKINYLKSIIDKTSNEMLKQEFDVLQKIMVEKWQKTN